MLYYGVSLSITFYITKTINCRDLLLNSFKIIISFNGEFFIPEIISYFGFVYIQF